MDEPSQWRLEAEARILQDPLAYSNFNPAQVRFVKAVADPNNVIVVADMGNGSGKTFGLVAIWSAVMFGTDSRLFDIPDSRFSRSSPVGEKNPVEDSQKFSAALVRKSGRIVPLREKKSLRPPPPIGGWRYPRSARLCAPAKVVEDTGPIQDAIRECFPLGFYEQSKGSGKGYYSQGKVLYGSGAGWIWDVMTYNQSVEEFAGATRGLILYSEPPPRSIFIENLARGRAGCVHVIEMTPLDQAAWLFDEYIDVGELRSKDGRRSLGKIALVRGDIEDNCREHSPGGQLPHDEIERTIASWPEEEREARRTGLPLHLAGRIYPTWGDDNEIESLHDYHHEAIEAGCVNLVHVLDPHDRKPWAMAWKAVFPNNDRITLAEWPPFDFHKAVNSPISDVEDYRDIILATEAEIGLPLRGRIIDPNFGNAPKTGKGETVREMLARSCRRCAEAGKPKEGCSHSLTFLGDVIDDIAQGHMIVRRDIGDLTKGVRPKTFALQACRNHCYSMRHYAYREDKSKNPAPGYEQRPGYIAKDFADLERYMAVSYLAQYQSQIVKARGDLWTPKIKGRSVRMT